MAIRKSSSSGIPFGNTAGRPGNPNTGQPYFNGEVGRLELMTTTGWQNIVQETPGIAGITGAYNESTGSATITISGTNFVSGAIASAIGSNGVELQATTTTYNSIVQLTAVFTGLNAAYEPYDIRVTNPSNLFGLLPDALYINQSPVWQYSSGSLGTFPEGVSITPISALATDPENTSLTFSITSGSLPAGLSLNTSTGVISGTPSQVSSNTTYSFTISVSDGNNTVARNFSILINSIVSWNTAAGNIGTVSLDVSPTVSYTLSANALGNTVSYSVLSGSLPGGLSLNESTGVISGTANTVSSNTTFTFTIRASDGTATADREFNIVVNAQIVSGGTVYSDSTHIYRAFTSGTSNLVLTSSVPIQYVLVAGGGGGGAGNAAGGGAGGLIEISETLASGTYPIVIGQGGNGGSSSSLGSDGANSTAFGKTAIGGGGGAWDDKSGRPGGSGGGGADDPTSLGGAGLQPGSASGGYGNRGGNVSEPNSSGGGGGGGGAGGAGADVVNNNEDPNQHYGGIGRTSSIINAIGAATGLGHLSSGNYYFAGGGSGAYKTSATVVAARAGGGGTGGNGGSATANTGGGGGGAQGANGGAGASGVCVVRYAKTAVGG
jgi:mucin-19